MNLKSISNSLTNLTITSAKAREGHGIGAIFDTIQSRLANGGRDSNCKFYYNAGAGGSLIQVAIKSVVGGVVKELKDEADNAFRSRYGKKKKVSGYEWNGDEVKRQKEEAKTYGHIEVGDGTIYALDEWGCISPDALMLAIDIDNEVTTTQTFQVWGNQFGMLGESSGSKSFNAPESKVNVVKSKTLVWYDTTALINISSDKNIVITRVQGRDYSRKELVSNGDIKFSVSGQITSGKPDIYPTEEVRKFIKVMQHKGIIRINNQVLDQFGITHIVITDFNLSSKEGYKAVQQYTFSAIGLQPEKEIEIKEDTISIIPQKELTKETPEKESNGWKDILEDLMSTQAATDIFTQGTALASGMLENML